MTPVGIVLLNLWTSNLLPQIVSRLILIRFSISGTVSILTSIVTHWLPEMVNIFCSTMALDTTFDNLKARNIENSCTCRFCEEINDFLPHKSLVDITNNHPKNLFFNQIQEKNWKIENIKKNFELSLGWRDLKFKLPRGVKFKKHRNTVYVQYVRAYNNFIIDCEVKLSAAGDAEIYV